jgi:hypothetical protein
MPSCCTIATESKQQRIAATSSGGLLLVYNLAALSIPAEGPRAVAAALCGTAAAAVNWTPASLPSCLMSAPGAAAALHVTAWLLCCATPWQAQTLQEHQQQPG